MDELPIRRHLPMTHTFASGRTYPEGAALAKQMMQKCDKHMHEKMNARRIAQMAQARDRRDNEFDN